MLDATPERHTAKSELSVLIDAGHLERNGVEICWACVQDSGLGSA